MRSLHINAKPLNEGLSFVTHFCGLHSNDNSFFVVSQPSSPIFMGFVVLHKKGVNQFV